MEHAVTLLGPPHLHLLAHRQAVLHRASPPEVFRAIVSERQEQQEEQQEQQEQEQQEQQEQQQQQEEQHEEVQQEQRRTGTRTSAGFGPGQWDYRVFEP